jgi:Arc/MetJ family transcription regulator
MRTTLDINEKLLKDAVELSEEKTKTAAVEAVLREYVRLRSKEMLLGLRGKIQIEDNWRELRQMEIDEISGVG